MSAPRDKDALRQEAAHCFEILDCRVIDETSAFGPPYRAFEEEFSGIEVSAQQQDAAHAVHSLVIRRIEPQSLDKAPFGVDERRIVGPTAALQRIPVPNHVTVLYVIPIKFDDHRIERPFL